MDDVRNRRLGRRSAIRGRIPAVRDVPPRRHRRVHDACRGQGPQRNGHRGHPGNHRPCRWDDRLADHRRWRLSCIMADALCTFARSSRRTIRDAGPPRPDGCNRHRVFPAVYGVCGRHRGSPPTAQATPGLRARGGTAARRRTVEGADPLSPCSPTDTCDAGQRAVGDQGPTRRSSSSVSCSLWSIVRHLVATRTPTRLIQPSD